MKSLGLLLVTSISCFAANEQPYEIIENKAELPLFNPSLAERKTLKIRLDNGLEAYLISDPKAEQSAAGLSVEAGSWQDPKEYAGMAHFLEHMLFMGTAAYPNESEYMQFIADNGGLVNAATWPDHTVYMFSVNNEAFSGALDRFSHFFIDPLFSVSCIERELHAVDQEHAKNVEHDGWREYMIFKETGNPAHPISAFSTGNAKTLSGIPQEALKKWYQQYYTARHMHLVMISPLPLDKMTALVVKGFSGVRDTEIPTQSFPSQMASKAQLGHKLYIKPVKDLRRLSLTWEIPQEFAGDKERRAVELVAYALQNQSEKSLLEELKREKIAEDLDVSADRFGKNEMLLRIDIALTKDGVSQMDTAILRCYQAIARLKEKGIPFYLFDEMERTSRLDYQYQSRKEAFEFITKTANAMIYENIETYPEKTEIPYTYDPEFLSAFINTLTPEKCIYVIQADPQVTEVALDKKEKWMNAEYTIKDIPQTTLAAWTKARTNPQIDLPPSNPFIPTQITPVSQESSQSEVPVLIADDVGAKIYYAEDKKYLVPEISAFFSLKTPLIDGSPRKSVLSDLYTKALTDKLSSTLFFSRAAGLNPSFSNDDLKFTISVQGFSEKAPMLLKNIFQALKNVTPTQDQFEIYKQSLLSLYDNSSKELPVKQAKELLASMISKQTPTNADKLEAIKSVTYEDFISFSHSLFKKSYTEGLVYGSLSQDETESLWADLKKTLSSTPYTKTEQIKKQILVLPEKQGPYYIMQHTQRQGNGVILVLQEGSFTFPKRAAQQILAKALHDGFFDTLRTKQQTAYIAQAWDVEIERQLLQFFAVQSNSHHPSELIARFELFIEDFVKNLPERISKERFENIQSMLITTLQMPPENLSAMGARLYLLAFEYGGNFDWYEKRIDSMKALTYDQLLKTTREFLSRDNQRRLAVLVEGQLPPENHCRYERVTKEDICELGTYTTK